MHRGHCFGAGLLSLFVTVLATAQEKRDDDAQNKANAIAAVAKAKISLKEAINAAQKKLPTGKPIEAEIALQSDNSTYTIELHADGKQMDVDVDSVTGVASDPHMQGEEESKEDDDDAEVVALQTPTSLLKALELGQSKAPTGKAFYIGVAIEEGKAIYEVDFVAGDKIVTVEVDAANGEILSVDEE